MLTNKSLGLRLRQAAAKGNLQEVQEILGSLGRQEKSSIINEKSPSSGNSPQLWAAIAANPKCSQHISQNAENYFRIIALLLENGADITVRNKDNKTVDDYAEDTGWCKVGHHLIHYEQSNSIEKVLQTETEQTVVRDCSSQFFLILWRLKIAQLFKNEQRPIRILSLGCGTAVEAIALRSYFSLFGREIEFVGIDNDGTDIQRNKILYSALPNIEVHEADASSVEALERLGYSKNSFDLGILRNGNFDNSNGRQHTFMTMVNNVFPYFLRDDSPLITTFYNAAEAYLFRDLTDWPHFCSQPSPNCVSLEERGVRIGFFTTSNKVHPDNISIVTIFSLSNYLEFSSSVVEKGSGRVESQCKCG